MAFTIELRSKVGPVAFVVLDGRLTYGEGADKVENFIQDLVAHDERAVLLDMSKVPVVDSRGIKALVHSFTSLRKRGGHLKLLRLSPRVREVLGFMRLVEIFEVFDDEQTALKSF
ncbi:MAG TPA: STAS domain-containing protein [Candidatus Acidoferrales bacterium]|nr:STAS domain-containing protein [Candidatus Acidoferrales bacterium]